MRRARKEPNIPPKLSDDVLLEIFLLFPVSELVQFMFVCRSWYKLITSSLFAETHRRRWNDRGQMVLVPLTFHGSVMYKSLENPTAGLNLDRFLHDFAYTSLQPPRNHDQEFVFYYEILDSCDGLLLIHISSYHHEDPESDLEEALLLCNPVRGLCKVLHIPSYQNVFFYNTSRLIYDPSIKRYKVMWAIRTLKGGDLDCYLIEVDPSQDQITPWIKLGLLPVQTFGEVEAVVSCEQKVHWLINSESGDLTLVTLDVTTQKSKTTCCPRLPFDPQDVSPLYTGSNGKFYHVRSLVELGESELWEFELWYLTWLNDRPTWFKHKFRMSPPPPRPPNIDFIDFVGELEEDKKFVFESRGTLVVYDITSWSYTNIVLEDRYLDIRSNLPSIVHVNTLLSYAREC